MADEYSKPPYNRDSGIPTGCTWQDMRSLKGIELEDKYKSILETLGKQSGLLSILIKLPGCAGSGFEFESSLAQQSGCIIGHPELTCIQTVGTNHGIAALGDDYVDVVFYGTAKTYRYSYASAGRHPVEQMKKLAEQGIGLNSYIMRNTRLLYER